MLREQQKKVAFTIFKGINEYLSQEVETKESEVIAIIYFFFDIS